MKHRPRVAVMIDLGWPDKQHHEVFAGIHRYAEEHTDWDCVLDLYADQSLGRRGLTKGYDGVIARATPELAAKAKEARVPVVNVWLNSPVTALPSAFPDMVDAGRIAAEHLSARGFRRLCYLGYHRHRDSRRQLEGFRAAARKSGPDMSVRHVPQGYGDSPEAWDKFKGRLSEWVDTWIPPVGVCCVEDVLCRYLLDVCLEKGLHSPQEVAMVGGGNEGVICSCPEPSLSSIDFAYRRVGTRASRMLRSLLNGETLSERIELQGPHLVVRHTTDVFAVDDPQVADALRFMAGHSHEPIRVGDVVTHASSTRRTLERRFRNALDRSIAAEITRLRLERVKRQLLETDESIKDVARASGFRSATRLCAAFLAATGMTPESYRVKRRPGGAQVLS